MAELQPSKNEPIASQPIDSARPPPQPRGPPLNQIYALPAPIRTFPLPTFFPNNPVSVLHVAYAWLGQLWSPPLAEPSVVHQGVWSSSTSSVHITEQLAIRALWEQGFYGKGNLSRSEPNWLKREQVRRGLHEGHVSEILTAQRREERMRAKWERARLEQEAIRQTRLEEAQAVKEAESLRQKARLEPIGLGLTKESSRHVDPLSPVSPDKLVALPNSAADLIAHQSRTLPSVKTVNIPSIVTDLSDGNMNSKSHVASTDDSSHADTDTNDNGHGTNSSLSTPSSPTGSDRSKSSKKGKSVRFSPKVESTTFKLMDPPSPTHALAQSKLDEELVNKTKPGDLNGDDANAQGTLVDKEYLQLMPEEAFFLSYGLGALKVTDPATGKTLSSRELLTFFRQYSYFPPRIGPEEPVLQPDDSFMVHYSVYHHFRSLGWVPRGGIKFGVDWMLYARGPVFDHAEFGLIVIPSYSDPEWKQLQKSNPEKTWQWFHGTIRVLSHVTKSLVLVYVDVPPPSKFDEALETGVTDVLKLYKVREVMVKRWSSNRNR